MKFKDRLEGDIVIFDLSGKIISYSDDMTMFHGRIREYANLNKNNVVIDLAKIEMVGSVGLGMLISALSTVNKAGGRLVLANITRIQNLIAMTRLNTVFQSYDSVEEAMNSFNKS
ncbi:MAG: STAS domain-containing protein [candidate division Zixibacteria bacterium]|nr:STAS domain-containing protein [candidate division Zixibacteria bacterium]